MKKTTAVKDSKIFRRMYAKADSVVFPCIVVYWRKNRLSYNRLGLTSAKKIGIAVRRNRARRVMREAYRLLEPGINTGYDIILVARTRTPYVPMATVMRELKHAFVKAEIYNSTLPSLSVGFKSDKKGQQNA